MKCPKCGAENLESAKFCFKCGANFETEEPVTETPESKTVPEESVNKDQESESVPMQTAEPTAAPTHVDNSQKKDNKKVLLIVAIIIVVAAIAAAIWYFTSGKGDSIAEEIYNTDSLIAVEENGKYGYIDTDGKLVINMQYDTASPFYGKFAVVSKKVEVDGIKDTVYQVIDMKGKVKAESQYASYIEYIEEENLWIINGQLHDGNLKALSAVGLNVAYEDEGYFKWYNYEKKTAGIMNKSGKVTYTYQFTGEESYLGIDPSEVDESLKDRYCRVNVENEKYAIVNCDTGKVIYDFTTDFIYEKNNNIFEISNKKTYDFISCLYIQNDKIAYKTTNKKEDIYYYKSGKYVQITDYDKPYDERYSYIDIKTGEITKEKPKNESEQKADLDEWEEYSKMQKFSCSSGYGIMSGDTVKIQCQWSDIDYLDLELYKYLSSKGKNYILAEKDSKYYIINLKTGKTEAEFNTTYIYSYEGSTFINYTDSETKKKVYYNLATNKAISFETNIIVRVYSNYIVATENGKKNYYNAELKQIYTEK